MAMCCSPIVCVLEKMHQKQWPECKPFLKGAGALTNVFVLYTANMGKQLMQFDLCSIFFVNCMLIARHLEMGNKTLGVKLIKPIGLRVTHCLRVVGLLRGCI